jgi:uncharacterized protein (DUF362 family)
MGLIIAREAVTRGISHPTLVIAATILLVIAAGGDPVLGQMKNKTSKSTEQSGIVELLTALGPIVAAEVAVVDTTYILALHCPHELHRLIYFFL